MPRIVWVAVGIAFAVTACSSSSYQLHPVVEENDLSTHYIEEYETLLSYEPGSVVAVSGSRQGTELVLTVAVRNASDEAVEVVPEDILVAAGDPDQVVTTLPAYSPTTYLAHRAAAQGTKLGLQAESVDRETWENVRVATETTRVDPIPMDVAGSFFGRVDSPDRWSSVARRSAEIRNEAEALHGQLEAVSRELLWPETLEPGEYTFGKVALSRAQGFSQYRVVVPVGNDYHEFVLVTGPEGGWFEPSPEPAFTSN